jgi:hypothetical protein
MKFDRRGIAERRLSTAYQESTAFSGLKTSTFNSVVSRHECASALLPGCYPSREIESTSRQNEAM